MKKFALFISIFFLINYTYSQEFVFSDSVDISLITCSPGPQVYAKFGHSGVRVQDKINKYDFIFNWGIFSFNTENFYIKFIKGETDYLLGVQYTSDFLEEYQKRNSVVWEQVLNLTVTEKKRLLSLLLDNYKEENRRYRYNFVYDNCATRPRDVVVNCIDGHVIFQDVYDTKTFRHAIGDYIGSDTWLRFGIDLIFGFQADYNMPQLQSMFLPEILKFEFSNAHIANKSYVQSRSLVKKSTVLVSSDVNMTFKQKFYDNPFYVFGAIFILVLLISIYEFLFDKKYNTLIDSILLFVTGTAGVIVFFLMFFSIHPLVKYNFNILWLSPLNIIAACMIWFKKWRIHIFAYQLFNLILVALALVAVAISLQSFNQATFLIIATLLVRYSCWIYRTKRK
ncbi:MAG: DUF4105 domain-containing protein, partial [Paludibacter sp.]